MAVMPSVHAHNSRQLYHDIFWFGVLAGSAQAFLAVYAARIGASGLQVGLLTAGPAVVNMLFSLPAARRLEGRSLIRTTLQASLWNRAGYAILLLLPVVLVPALQVWALPALIALMSIPILQVFFLFYTSQFAPIPILPLYFVRALRLSDSAISIGNALFHGCTPLFSMRLSGLTRTFGHHRVLAVSAVLYGAYPILIGLADNPNLYWVASLAGGAVWGLASGSSVTRLMERVPTHDRPAHMALHNLVLNLGVLAGSLLGPLLSGYLPLRAVLFLTGALRFLGGVLIALRG